MRPRAEWPWILLGNPHLHRPALPLTAPFSWVQPLHACLYKSCMTRRLSDTHLFVYRCSAFPAYVHWASTTLE